jgi:hypothetical protein
MRRWIATVLTVLMLANVAVWPTAVAAEVEHEREAIEQSDNGAPAEQGGAHCNHGCAGHYGHHFQLQASSLSYQSAPDVSASAFAASSALPPKFIPTLPFRPPLST